MDNSRNKNTRSYYIVLGILTVLIVVLGVTDVYLWLKPRESSNNKDNNETVVSNDDVVVQKKNYMDLTKEEAMAAFREMQKPNYIPSGYIDKAVIPSDGCVPLNGLIYSYEKEDEIKEIYENDQIANIREFQKAEFVKDYYAVAFSVPFDYDVAWAEDGVASGCMRMFSFNAKYYDYSEEDFLSGVFVNTSTDFIKVALPVLATSSGEIARLDMVYSYDFEEEEDNITLNIHSIGLGYDTDYSDLEAYEQQKKAGTLSRTLQFITQKYRYDASTKKADWVRDCENCVFGAKVDRNIPLSDSEVSSLLENTRYK